MSLLYELDIKDSSNMADVDISTLSDFQLMVLKTYLDNKIQIDDKISNTLVKWTMSSLARVDLALLRLCITESLYIEEIPYKVAIDEAIEIAKIYGDEKSTKFINGIMRQCLE